MTDTKPLSANPFWLFCLALLLLRILQISLLPVTTDEAYYFSWTKQLAWGYFDHPPMVSWLAATQSWLPGVVGVARLGTLVMAMLTIAVIWRLCRQVGFTHTATALTALLLATCNLLALAGGVLTTPDVPLLFWWAVALHEATVALQRDPRRWLTAGLATGCGILSKYTMLFMGPVFLWGLLRSGNRSLAKPWPYLGGICCLLVVLPHLNWQHQHNWVTFQFQLAHGFGGDGAAEFQTLAMPKPETPPDDSIEAQMGAAFQSLHQAEAKAEKKPKPYDPLLKSLNRYLGFYGAQIAFWGLLLIPLGWSLRSRDNRSRFGELFQPIRGLIHASYIFPLVFLGLLALFRKVEANWSAMSLIGLSLAMAPMVVRQYSGVLMAAIGNAFLLVVLILHAHLAILPIRPHKDRIRVETAGYDKLVMITDSLPGYLFTDTYQNKAMLDFYGSRPVVQYPGISRHSEYTRNPVHQLLTVSDIRSFGSFSLLTNRKFPPYFQGFKAQRWTMLRYCYGEPLQQIDWTEALTQAEERCKTPIHVWYLAHYHRQKR